MVQVSVKSTKYYEKSKKSIKTNVDLIIVFFKRSYNSAKSLAYWAETFRDCRVLKFYETKKSTILSNEKLNCQRWQWYQIDQILCLR